MPPPQSAALSGIPTSPDPSGRTPMAWLRYLDIAVSAAPPAGYAASTSPAAAPDSLHVPVPVANPGTPYRMARHSSEPNSTLGTPSAIAPAGSRPDAAGSDRG